MIQRIRNVVTLPLLSILLYLLGAAVGGTIPMGRFEI